MKAKMAIIGATGSAYKRTIPQLADSAFCEVTAIQGRDVEKLKKISNEFQIGAFYTDERELIEREDYDLIYIANPPFMHFQSFMNVLRKRGTPVIMEKPLDVDYANGERYRDYIGAPFMVAHHLRHQTAYRDLKTHLGRGTIGQVLNVYCQWGFALNPKSSNSVWKRDRVLGGGGTFSDNGIHTVDLILGLFGKPERVAGHALRANGFPVYDNETAMLLYRDKTVTLSSSHTMEYPGNHLLIYGTKGKIEAFGAMGERSIRSIRITTAEGERNIGYPEECLYRAEVENFVRKYIFGEDIPYDGTTYEEAMTALRIVDLARKSGETDTIYRL